MELTKIQMLLAKVESTAGTDASPTAASNNIAFYRDSGFVQPDGDAIVRDIADGGYGQVAGLTSMKTVTFKFQVEIRANRTNGVADDISKGAIGNVIDYDPILRAADLAATYTSETTSGSRDGCVTYQPTIPTDEGVTLTVYGYSHKKVYKAVGCKASITGIRWLPGKIARLEIEIRGAYSEIADATFPTTGAWLSTVAPCWANRQRWLAQAVTAAGATDNIALTNHGLMRGNRVKFGGTPPTGVTAGDWYYVRNVDQDTFKLSTSLNGALLDLTSDGSGVTLTSAGGFWVDGWTDAVCGGVNFNLGQQLTAREDGSRASGLKGFMLSDRQSSGDFTIESVQEATHPIWADWAAGTVKTLHLDLGAPSGAGEAGSGNHIQIEAKIRLMKPSYSDASGKRMMNVPFTMVQSAPGTIDGSEFKLIFQ